MKYFSLLFLFYLLFSCSNKNSHKTSVPFVIDNLTISDTTFFAVNKLLKLDDFIVLDKSVPLANIERVIIAEDKIYIFDSEPKIVCYNFDGQIEYKIDRKGKGVGEFMKIVDFSIDKKKQLLKLYDSSLRKIFYYSLNTGKFQYSGKISLAPHAIATFKEYNYFYNPYDFNYPKKLEFHFSLMKSKTERNFSDSFFPHDPVLSKYLFGNGGEFPFFYGDDELLFINRFENMVFSIDDTGVYPFCEIKLPNAVSKSFLHSKPKPMDLINSKYSSGLTDIYRVNNILYFSFTNSGKSIFAFYDLLKKKVIYCGKRVWCEPIKELPVYYPIRGISGDRFVSLVSASTVVRNLTNNKSVFPQKLQNVKEIDNPIVVFFSIKNEK